MIRGPGDSIATKVASYDGSIYRWHFLFAEDGFVMLVTRSRCVGPSSSGSVKIGANSMPGSHLARAEREEYSRSCDTSGRL